MGKLLPILAGTFLLGLLFSSPFIYYAMTLTPANIVLTSNEPGYHTEEKSYPPFLRCALRLNSDHSRWMAYKIAERLAGDMSNMLMYNFRRHVLVYPVRFTYPLEARRRVYLKLFGSSDKYPSIEDVCIGLFKKPCRALSERESVLLEAWTSGGEKLVELVINDQPDIEKRIQLVRTRCDM